MDAIPLLVLGDAPGESSGLARIARDLTAHLHADADRLGIRVAQLGLGWAGPSPAWPVYPIRDGENWGQQDLERAWQWHVQGDTGVLFSVWDPARCFATATLPLAGGRRWGYFPIDAHNAGGGLSGPAGEAVTRYQRVLAYTRWGSRILRSCTNGHPVSYLPHGLDLLVFRPEIDSTLYAQIAEMLWPTVVQGRHTLVGCVSTNQPRKDLGLLFAAIRIMRGMNARIRLWLHIDKDISPAWSVPQLASDFELEDALVVTHDLTDAELAALYAICGVTIAPGLGEGFCYPIAESLACGTPAVHGTFGGGAEIVPKSEWRYPEVARRYESVYALVRPVYDPLDVANAAMRALNWVREDSNVVREYCRGAVAHLDWSVLWPRWRSWVAQGLEAV
jgi:glycosyltransferase involved in cell wall biosynthesis